MSEHSPGPDRGCEPFRIDPPSPLGVGAAGEYQFTPEPPTPRVRLHRFFVQEHPELNLLESQLDEIVHEVHEYLKATGPLYPAQQVDVSTEERARVLHRVVRALHDGHCPSCGHVASNPSYHRKTFALAIPADERCEDCGFTITGAEIQAALAEFRPVMQRNLEIFQSWRESRQTKTAQP